MKNYLSYRWPDTPPGDWVPEAPKRPCRRAARSLLVTLLLLGLLGGIAAGGWFLAGTALRRWAAEQEGVAQEDHLPLLEQPEDSQLPVTALPRAETGLGVTLELDDTLSSTLATREIYDLVLPSVVSVSAQSPQGYGAGSGIIMREDGYILTNHHVIEGAARVTVMLLEDGARWEAKLVGYDEALDVAVLKIEAEGLTAARFGDSDALKVGDLAYAIGNPMGYLYGTMTDGIISYLDRSQTVAGNEMTLIQTSAVLNSGSSGGALVNERGQVVGITVAKVSGRSTAAEPQAEGLGFAIPISAARPFINRILDAGESWRPSIGIKCLAVEESGVKGVRVEFLTPDGPAQRAGMREKDLITSANGRTVDTVYSLKRVLNEAGVGGEVECAVLRGGEELSVVVVPVDGSELEQ